MLSIALREPVSAWSHASWLILSVPATWLLWRRGGVDRARRVSLLVFGLSLAFCYAGSALYHGARVSAAGLDALNVLDHIGIFVLIAGSYTPIAWTLMRRRWRLVTLASAWSGCAAGTALLLTLGLLPPSVGTGFYLAMGWGALACYRELARALSHRKLAPLVLGGLFYSVGALLNLLGWPNPWRGVLGAHEVFHLFVMAGSLSHFWFMLRVVAPHPVAIASASADRPSPAAASGRPPYLLAAPSPE